MEVILNRIISLRKAKKISQKEISESLGISQAAYAKFESGNSITIDRLYKIAEFLGVTISEILDIEPTKLNKDINESLILEIDNLKKQIEENAEDLRSYEEIIGLLKRVDIKTPLAIINSYLYAMSTVINSLFSHESEESRKLVYKYLNSLTVSYERHLVEYDLLLNHDFDKIYEMLTIE